ncbi:MAG: efflux RND transporter periplasmic adaptor subunit [Elusimicrobiota bacterium]|jgi:macrolide-specific efflux system membrane fusion protein|nr:efflux RND transporter periplasmic adaptor subunit [Elusimicrobiota bacterium]
MRKSIAILIVFAVFFLVFFVLKPTKQNIEKSAMPEKRDLVVSFRETGEVSPRNRLEIKPPFSGRIEKILIDEGVDVEKGQVIIWMSSSERAAMIDAARAIGKKEYEKWETIYKPTPIVAPMNGFIILRQNEPGQTVTASDAILVMADDLIIEADIDETDLKFVKIGGEVDIYLDAYPNETFKGIIEHIAYESKVVSNVTVYAIKIRPAKKPEVFRAGMTATITIIAHSKKDTLSIPTDLIVEKARKKVVTVKTKKGFVQREIQEGLSDGKWTEIVSGLDISEQVVILKSKKKEKGKSFISR